MVVAAYIIIFTLNILVVYFVFIKEDSIKDSPIFSLKKESKVEITESNQVFSV